MANYRHTIEVEARFVDNLSGEADSASRSISGIGTAAKKAKEDVNKLGRADATPGVGLDTSKFTSAMDKVNRLLDKIKKIHTVAINLKDSNAYQKLKKITDTVEGLARKTWSVVVKVKDIALSPFRAVRNALFSIQTLATAIFAGIAAKTAIINPINVADAYSSAKIGFSTLLGESGGQRMMDQLDQFAKATPFKTTSVIGNAQKMMAMGWSTDTLIEDMEIIGNAAAATGKLDQGLESIVRALSQIKTKGKLSTEELNQLSEAGIAAKAMLAEQLGYGTGDSGIAKMSEDLEAGVIGSEQAIQALLAGMKRYDGMMDSMANETVEGLISQMQDAFEINIVRKWGQGLQDGAKRGFGTVITLLDQSEEALAEFGEMLYEIGHTASTWVADKFENMVSRVLEITDTFEFKNASLGEKVSMLWKGVIADPLKEWWEGGGREKTSETAGKIGAWMGETLTKGILAILGVTDIFKESKLDSEGGASVAQSFARGFVDNFDVSAITDKIVEAIGNVWGALPWWAKTLIVGYGGSKLALGGMNLISGVAGAVGGIGSFIGSASGMTGLLGFGTKAAIGLGAGNLAGGASLGAGALSAIGLGSTAGGIAAIASAGKGLFDLYNSKKAFNEGNKTEGWARAASGGTTIGGVLAGAGIGAAIGSVVPVLGNAVGALIGAGVGGIAGWIGGDKWANNIRAAKYESEEMNEAIKDGEKSAEELAEIFERAKWEDAKKHFGDIKLSMEEITRLANQIVWGDDIQIFEQFSSATNTAEASIKSLKTAAEQTNRWMWKSGLGVSFDDDEKEAFAASFSEFVRSAISFAENKHYEFSASADLLLDLESENGKSILEGGNAFYARITEQLNSLGSELTDKVTIALDDGVISLDEEAEIKNLQQQIADITSKLADAESAAELELIKVKFGSGKLDNESFDNFMSVMETTLNDRVAAQDEAFKLQVANLKLRFPDGGAQYTEELNELIGGYTANVSNIAAEVQSVQLDIIGDAYSDVLGDDGKSRLMQALDAAVEAEIDSYEFQMSSDKVLAKMLGLDESAFDGKSETAANLREYLCHLLDQVGTVQAGITAAVYFDEVKVEDEATDKVKLAVDGEIPPSLDETILLNLNANPLYQKIQLSGNSFLKSTSVTATPTVTIQPRFVEVLESNKYSVGSNLRKYLPGATQNYRGGFVGGSSALEGFANGGFVRGGARLVTVAEEGTPEVIIPLGSHRRARGLELWKKAGEMLGVKNYGRMLSGSGDQGIRNNAYNVGAGDMNAAANVNVGGVSVSIHVDASSGQNVAEVIKAQSGEIAETVAEMLAAELGAQFENTPTKGGAA